MQTQELSIQLSPGSDLDLFWPTLAPAVLTSLRAPTGTSLLTSHPGLSSSLSLPGPQASIGGIRGPYASLFIQPPWLTNL